MNRAEMRTYYTEVTGKFNKTADQLNRLLDLAAQFLAPKLAGHIAESYFFTALGAGTNILDLSAYLTSARLVYRLDSNHAFTKVKVYSKYEEFLEDYSSLDATGIPEACVRVPPLAMQVASKTPATLDPNEKYQADWFGTGKGLLYQFNCKAEADVQLRVLGVASIARLETDQDSNYLTMNEPMLYCQGIEYILEINQRNYENANKLLQSIMTLIQAISVSGVQSSSEALGDQIDG